MLFSVLLKNKGIILVVSLFHCFWWVGLLFWNIKIRKINSKQKPDI